MRQADPSKALFPRLAGGPGGIGRNHKERHQRGRLEGAMVAAVARHGYAETTVAELVGLAGVSKSTFYQHFSSKEECFLATFDTIVDEATTRVADAYKLGGGLEDRLAAAFQRFVTIVREETDAASLVVVDSLTLGRAAIARRERASQVFERMIRQSFDAAPGDLRPSELAIRVIVAGIWTVVYRCIRTGNPEELTEHLPPLLAWGLSYRSELPPPTPIARGFRLKPKAPELRVSWDEPADSPMSREVLSQRERIIRATAQVAARNGYAKLTIPAISAGAGTSNQTFYELFESKDEAFFAAFEELCDRALAATFGSVEEVSDWREAVTEGIGGLLEHSVAEPLFARLAFFEVPAAGPAALDRADETIKKFTRFLDPEYLPEEGNRIPPVVGEAIGGGMWGAIQTQIVQSGLTSLPSLASGLAAVVLIPLLT